MITYIAFCCCSREFRDHFLCKPEWYPMKEAKFQCCLALPSDPHWKHSHSLTWCRNQNLTTCENGQEEIIMRVD